MPEVQHMWLQAAAATGKQQLKLVLQGLCVQWQAGGKSKPTQTSILLQYSRITAPEHQTSPGTASGVSLLQDRQ